MPITVRNVSLTYNAGTPLETAAVKNVSFEIADGSFVGVMGHTGCGKSTMLQLIDGLLKPDSGEILIDGEDINGHTYDRAILRRKVGMVFQYPEVQLFETTVEKDVSFGLKHSGLPAQEVERRVRRALEMLGFDYEKVRKKSPLGFSGGEKRRIAIAGVLAVMPDYLLLDEPIAGLDPLARADFLELLKKLNSEGMTIVMISHNADGIAECASRLLVFEDGGLVEDGSVAEVFRDAGGLRQRGLGVSSSRELAELLHNGGIELPQDICTYEQLRDSLLQRLKGGGAK